MGFWARLIARCLSKNLLRLDCSCHVESPLFACCCGCGCWCWCAAAVAQKVYTKQDYTQAERWMSYNVSGLVHHTVRGVSYLADGRVFYRDPGAGGTAYMIADPAKGTVAPAFDNAKLAAALNTAMGEDSKAKVEAEQAGGDGRMRSGPGGGFSVTTGEGVFDCDAAVTACTEEPKPPSEEKVAEKPGRSRGRSRRRRR